MIAIDPVCKMQVETETARWKEEHNGQTYYFCGPGCMRSFRQNPELYISGGGHVEMGSDEHEGHHHH